MRLLTLTLLAAALAVPSAAQHGMRKPGSRNTAAISGGAYTADPGHTLVRWQVDHLGFSLTFGIFGDVTGALTLSVKDS
jgi:polyisoprenoid-binding protein YceI